MKYKIGIRKSDNGYSVCIPGLSGCWSQGATEAEAIDNIKIAFQEYQAVLKGRLSDYEIREVEKSD